MRYLSWFVAVSLIVAVASAAPFQGVVVKLDAQKHLVGVKHESTGKIYELVFESGDPLKGLSLGAKVIVDLEKKTISLAKSRFSFTKATTGSTKKATLGAVLPPGSYIATKARKPGLISIKNTETGREYLFSASAATLQNLKTSVQFRIGGRQLSSGGSPGAPQAGECPPGCELQCTGVAADASLGAETSATDCHCVC